MAAYRCTGNSARIDEAHTKGIIDRRRKRPGLAELVLPQMGGRFAGIS